MTTRLTSLCFDANDPSRLADFWAGALDWKIDEQTNEVVTLMPTDGTRFVFDFVLVPEKKVGKNRIPDG